MASFQAGKNSRATVGSGAPTLLTMENFSATYRGGDLDTTNFEDNGYETGIIGPFGLDWQLSGTWNASQNPIADPPGLYPRYDGDALIMYTNRNNSDQYFAMPVFRCIQSQVSSGASDKVTFNSSGKNQGIFSVPVGNT